MVLLGGHVRHVAYMNRRSFIGAIVGLPVVASVQQSWFSKAIAKGTVISLQIYGTVETCIDDVYMTIDTTRDIIMGPYEVVDSSGHS
jgi:hypothetical protein